MINRELIRIKVVQLTYAFYQNGNRNIDTAEKELFFSLSKAYDLYNHLLQLIVAIAKEERKRVEIASQRAEREGTVPPSTKFIDNKFALQLEENKALLKNVEAQKLSWEDNIEVVRSLCDKIETFEPYIEYMGIVDSSYEDDQELWRKIYKQLILGNPDIDAVLEEKSLYWNDDREVVDTFVLKTIKRFKPENGANQELLPEFMSEASRNWDFSRLAYMDVVIMQIAIAEMLTCPNIPVSVTINEYVDLAKIYSTPRSGGYINGMLDTIAHFLVNNKLMLKPIKAKETDKAKVNNNNKQDKQ